MDFDSGCTDQVISWKLKADYNVVFLLCNRKLPFRNCFMLAIFLHGWYDEEKRKRGMDMTMAERLQRLRKEHHFSQEQLAERLQVSRQAVSKWENGQTAPDLDNIIAMSNLYEVTTDYILIGKERDSVPCGRCDPDSFASFVCQTISGMDVCNGRQQLYEFPVLFDRVADAWCHRSCSRRDCHRYLASEKRIMFQK